MCLKNKLVYAALAAVLSGCISGASENTDGGSAISGAAGLYQKSHGSYLSAIKLSDGSSILAYSNVAFSAPRTLEHYTRLILAAHGAGGNADVVFDALMQALGKPSDTAIVVPYFGSAKTPPSLPGISPLTWSSTTLWSSGERGDQALSSFDVLNDLAGQAMTVMPALRHVTYAGFSAGGQMIQRFAATNAGIPAGASFDVNFIIASPSSYVYFDNQRLRASARCDSAESCFLSNTSFAPGSYDKSCPDYNTYKFGPEALPSYLATDFSASAYLNRHVSYLVNTGDASDTPEDYNGAVVAPDKKCGSVVQGPDHDSYRLQRGLTYLSYLAYLAAPANDLSAANHHLYVLDGAHLTTGYKGGPCAHNEYCVYGSALGQALLTDGSAAGEWTPH